MLSFQTGSSPGALLLSSAFASIPRISQPFVLSTDPIGHVRAASFATADPLGTGVASSNQLLATLMFQAVGIGTTKIQPRFQPGDDVTYGLASVTLAPTIADSLTITVIPEPTTSSLIGMGLVLIRFLGPKRIVRSRS